MILTDIYNIIYTHACTRGRLALLAAAFALCGSAQAQSVFSTFKHGNEYTAEMSGQMSGDGKIAPFWFTANKHGLSTLRSNSGYLRGMLMREAAQDTARNWRAGYGLDVAFLLNHRSGAHRTEAVIQQLYGEVEWKMLRLTVGARDFEQELKNEALSSGGLTHSANARAVPQVRLEMPKFWAIPGTKGWLSLKGHVAYGMFTDNAWQNEFHAPGMTYSNNALFHSKAGFLKIGNTDKFPLTFTGGLEMYAQFGGEAWNVGRRPDDSSDFTGEYVKMGHGPKDFFNAFIPGGSDPRDGDYANVEGNQLGSWHLRFDYKGKGWGAAVYAEHFFEDHSQMFLEYGWKDMLYGVELQLPKNPVVSTVLYEHLRTTDQTGPVYHDATDQIPDQISAIDNYYNHAIYGGWQHWGQGIGSPLLLGPAYNEYDGRSFAHNNIGFWHNRIVSHHFGLSGSPMQGLDYRVLYTYTTSLGNYTIPLASPRHAHYYMAEATYRLKPLPALSITAAVGGNAGSLLGDNFGAMLTVAYRGAFCKK